MTTRELKRLNHYPEFKNDASIDNIISFIQTKKSPTHLDSSQLKRYRQKFGDNSGFIVENNKLFYRPLLPNRKYEDASGNIIDDKIDLEVVKPSQREEKIKPIYEDIKRGLGTGLNAFYHQVAMKYLNIFKKDTDTFLRKQGDYIVRQIPHKAINRPIVTRLPNERWACDLIDMRAYSSLEETPDEAKDIPELLSLIEELRKTKKKAGGRKKKGTETLVLNKGMQYIFTVIDFFSGKVWARAIPNRENGNPSPTLARALHSIGVEANNTIPHILQCDSEFNKGNFKDYCELDCVPPITIVQTTSYTPQSNGKIERMNREIRKKIKAGMITHNNLDWVQYLQDYIDNINNQQNPKTHLTPNQLWTSGFDEEEFKALRKQDKESTEVSKLTDNISPEEREKYNSAIINKRAVDLINPKNNKQEIKFKVNDLVRIRMMTMSNLQRKAHKNMIGWNKVAVHYTPQIYRVTKCYTGRKFSNDQYTLATLDGRALVSPDRQTNKDVSKRFFGSELIRVPQTNVQTHIEPLSVRRAEFLNRLVKNWAHMHN